MDPVKIMNWDELEDRVPAYALVDEVDLVVIRYDDKLSVFSGRCHHRGAILADGYIEGTNLICGLHFWDYRYDSGISAYNNDERLGKFAAWVEEGKILVDREEIAAWERENPQAFDRGAYQGTYADAHGTPEEEHVGLIQHLAMYGLSKWGRHGETVAMGVPRTRLPIWDDIQFVTAQLATLPLLEEVKIDTELVIGPKARKPLKLEIPLLVSDMSFGSLSLEAKVALAKGAEQAGTGICSGEGGMLAEEQAANHRYLYELASGRFGFSWDKLSSVQAFHFKGGQGAKTGTGGHLPGDKVTAKIAAVRGLKVGQAAISPPRFTDWDSLDDYHDFADQVRDRTGGIPIGFKLSAQHIEADIEAALKVGVDYLILDGRGGGTGAAPRLFRDNISVPTIPALARARRYLDSMGAHHVTLLITGGLRLPIDFAKALALGADGVALANAPLQALGCLGMRACQTNNCPVGIATQKPHLRARLPVDAGARRVSNFLTAATSLLTIMARACGHHRLGQFDIDDLTTWKHDMHLLTGIPFGGIGK